MGNKKSLFGHTYTDYERQGQKAINFLIKQKNGEVQNAVYNQGIGWIDIVFGFEGTKKSDGYGLAKLLKYHPKIIEILAEIIMKAEIVEKSENRYKLQYGKYFIAVSRVWFETRKTWLLTAFELESR